MSEYVLVLFDQKPVEIRIGTCDCGTQYRRENVASSMSAPNSTSPPKKLLISAVKLRLWTKCTWFAVKRRLVISRHARINVTDQNSIWCRFKRRGTQQIPKPHKFRSLREPSR